MEEQKRVYISGPMTGLEDCNLSSFFEAEALLRKNNFTPLNPARSPIGLKYNHYMDISLAMIRCSEAIYLLDGWEVSKGANVEVAYARSIGLQFLSLGEIKSNGYVMISLRAQQGA